jgi:lysophospholipase L1-like esterase
VFFPRENRTNKQDFRQFVGVVILAAFGLVMAAGSGEIFLRLIGYRPPVLLPLHIRNTYKLETPYGHFVYKGYLPGTFEDFENPVVLNRFGFHDRDYPFARPSSSTFRILVLGDSYVAANEMPLEKNFHKRLEQRLTAEDPLGRHSYQVIAFGQGNTAQQKELDWLRQYGRAYQPDMVLILFFCGNDIMENSPTIFYRAQEFALFYMKEIAPRKITFFSHVDLFPQSRLNGFIAERLTDIYAQHLNLFHPTLSLEKITSPELGVYQYPPSPEWQEAWKRSSSLLSEIKTESEKMEAILAIASLAGPQAIGDVGLEKLWKGKEKGIDLHQPERWIKKWSLDHKVPFIELGPVLSSAGRGKVFWKHDAHLTPFGDQLIADTLYPWVIESAGKSVQSVTDKRLSSKKLPFGGQK